MVSKKKRSVFRGNTNKKDGKLENKKEMIDDET